MKGVSPRLTFLLILGIFVLPLGLAWLMHEGVVGFGGDSTTNQGTLLDPAVPIDWSKVKVAGSAAATGGLEGNWVVLHQLPEDCSIPCLDRVTELRQVHRASGRHQDRISLALLLAKEPTFRDTETLANIYPLFNLLWQPGAEFLDSLASAQSNDGEVDFYLVDPRGNIMMTYNATDSAAKLSKDLKQLLTWSELD